MDELETPVRVMSLLLYDRFQIAAHIVRSCVFDCGVNLAHAGSRRLRLKLQRLRPDSQGQISVSL